MNITKKQEGATLVIALNDRLDTITAPQVDAEIQNGLDGVENLIWDFSDLDYITSAGLRVMALAQRKMFGTGTTKIINANDTVRGVFEMTGMDDMLSDE